MYENAKQLVRKLDRNDPDFVSVDLSIMKDSPELNELIYAVKYSAVVRMLKIKLPYDHKESTISEIFMLIASNTNLRFLDLSECYLSDDDGCKIAAGISLNKGLIYLNLSKNNIGDRAVEFIGNAVVKSEITHLDLTKNPFGAKGGEMLNYSILSNKNSLSRVFYNHRSEEVVNTTYRKYKFARVLSFIWVRDRLESENTSTNIDQVFVFKTHASAIALHLYSSNLDVAIRFEQDIKRLHTSLDPSMIQQLECVAKEIAKL